MTDRLFQPGGNWRKLPDPGDPSKHVHILLDKHGNPTMTWERELSAEEIKMLARDPYAMFLPPTIPVAKGKSDAER